MSSKDAYMFPVIGSATLFGLYLLFKYFSKEYINMLLTLYFLVFGASSLTATFAPITYFLFPAPRKHHLKFSLPYVASVDVKWGSSDVVALLWSVCVCLAYAKTKHWMFSNMLGLAFSIQGIALLSLGSYKTGAILLSGLFFYDIFWVFGTDVMVSVAKSFDAPIKLVFPRNIFAEEFKFSMLGLGDIVIPGFFVAMQLRFDRFMKHKKTPYFSSNFVAYVLGLVTTIYVMHTFKAAQPALLYLVPFCLGMSFVTAIAHGELMAMWAYTEEKDEEKDDKKKK
jgi:minor histocompatibility antigen H13